MCNFVTLALTHIVRCFQQVFWGRYDSPGCCIIHNKNCSQGMIMLKDESINWRRTITKYKSSEEKVKPLEDKMNDWTLRKKVQQMLNNNDCLDEEYKNSKIRHGDGGTTV